MIFAFSTQNADRSDHTSSFISKAIISVLYRDYATQTPEKQQEIYDNVQFVVRKCAHFSEYTLLGFMLRLCLESWFGHRTKKHRILTLIGLGAGASYACTDELHQLSIDGRSGQWKDVLVDSSGLLAGVTLGTLLIKSLKHRNKEEA